MTRSKAPRPRTTRLTPREQHLVDAARDNGEFLNHFFCDLCGKPFESKDIQLECWACIYAHTPHRVVLGADGQFTTDIGFARPTPLVKRPGVA